eukprot:TRINITY_DN14518_c0_g1_i1.p2 TRINITY_DN14518_c0_g1~~TRINITY_DN14518_c0_g1_i1.p2  ORF type:complete len:184 (-),score=35.38 TRINITY_DN14518_c0_g1_i1:179-730(-)
MSIDRAPRYQVPNHDIHSFLVGHWKRNLEWREFGNEFKLLRNSNTVVVIEDSPQKGDSNVGFRFLKWTFGKTLGSDFVSGYLMKLDPPAHSGETNLEWKSSGTVCRGQYIPQAGLIVMNFILRSSTVIVTYRIVDADALAVAIVEVDDRSQPTIQYGHMYRIDPELYADQSDKSPAGKAEGRH